MRTSGLDSVLSTAFPDNRTERSRINSQDRLLWVIAIKFRLPPSYLLVFDMQGQGQCSNVLECSTLNRESLNMHACQLPISLPWRKFNYSSSIPSKSMSPGSSQSPSCRLQVPFHEVLTISYVIICQIRVIRHIIFFVSSSISFIRERQVSSCRALAQNYSWSHISRRFRFVRLCL
jgi:hypothetical protein